MHAWGGGGGGEEVLPYKRLIKLLESLEWGRTYSDIWRKTVLHIYG